MKDRNGERERGGEWEPIKILFEGDRGSNKMNTASNTRLRLNYPSWSRPRSHYSAINPRNQQTTFRAKHTNTHSRNLHGLLPVLHRSDRWPAPVREVTPVRLMAEPVRPVAAAATQQMFQRASMTSLGPGTKTPQNTTLLTVKIRQPSHEFTFGVGMNFIPYPLVLTPVV
jgi:hypothetical protein